MNSSENALPAYREVELPGLGLVQIPAHLTDAEVLAQLSSSDAEATPAKKTNKKP